MLSMVLIAINGAPFSKPFYNSKLLLSIILNKATYWKAFSNYLGNVIYVRNFLVNGDFQFIDLRCKNIKPSNNLRKE